MSMAVPPPCGWRASSGLQYVQAVKFAPSPNGYLVGPFCGPPPGCCCPAPVPAGCLVMEPPPVAPAPKEAPKAIETPKPASFKPPTFNNSCVNFIPPKNISTLFIFAEAGPPKKGALKFQPWQIDSAKTVRDILEHLEKGDGKWSLVEYYEVGDGNWTKGITVSYKDERAKKAIPRFGWTSKRGGTLPPVWLATEKKE